MEFRFSDRLNEDIRMIRTTVFIKEQGFSDEFDDIDAHACHVVLYQNGQPIACGRTFPDENTPGGYYIGRIAVLTAFREKQVGSEVLNLLEDHVRMQGGTRATLSAQQQARGFYEKRGYHAQGSAYLDEGCPHILMVKDLQ
jgi:predicted GNAT family N-acyltransferase